MVEAERADRGPALVTGAGGGVGRNVVAALLDLGFEVIAAGRTLAPLEALADAAPGRVRPHVMDVRVEADWSRLLGELTDRGESVSVLVTAAGTSLRQDFLDTRPDQWRDLFELNVIAGMKSAHAVLPGMIDAGWGRLIFISSAAAKIGLLQRTSYCATKGAVESFVRALGLEVAGSGVTVNAIAPGFLDTDSVRGWLAANPDIRSAALEQIPEHRFGRTDELEAAVAFLVRSSYSQGSVVAVDGGWTSA